MASNLSGLSRQNTVYDNPLIERYASEEMSVNWSPLKKFSTWRKLWYELASCERELGLHKEIDECHLETLSAVIEQGMSDEDFNLARQYENKLRHDVMAHVHAFGDRLSQYEEDHSVRVKGARGIVHLGATSCFVGDNTDLVQMRDGMLILRRRLLQCMHLLKQFCEEHAALPCLGFTHFQPAQLTTVGKRASLWLQDLLFDFHELEHMLNQLPFRGVKGTTGTQASFLTLFEGDHEKVKQLDRMLTERMGFPRTISLAGQTYTRKIDSQILSMLSHIAESCHKMATDIRLWMSLKEVDEPFEEKQIGSSAMAYKRNPMRCERICALARFVMSLVANGSQTHASQWFERTLDDSANRRLTLPQAFLAVDSILMIVANVSGGLKVWPTVIRRRVMEELPFMATEDVLMACVKAGGDRQELHEYIRQHSLEAARRVKHEGADNDLLERIRADQRFSAVHASLDHMVDPNKFVGRAPKQVKEFVDEELQPVFAAHSELLAQIVKSDNAALKV